MSGEACPECITLNLSAENGDLVASQVAKAHVEEVDRALRAIWAEFRWEQDQGLELLERRWRAWTRSHDRSLEKIDKAVCLTLDAVERARERDFKVFLLLGIGGSDLAPRVIHECLDDPMHNVRPPEARKTPELHLAGDNFDPRPLNALLQSLRERTDPVDGEPLLKKTLVNVVSRSGKTTETIAALMVVAHALESEGVDDWPSHVVATTLASPNSVLEQMEGLLGKLPIPEGVGGRFSAASPVGLFPLAITATNDPGERIDSALQGFRRGHEQCFEREPDDELNVAFRLARWLHLAEHYGGKNNLVFYNYSNDRLLGDWVAQLWMESLQERGQGMNIIATRGPTGNHSILNGIVRGPRDKVVVFVNWQRLDSSELLIPTNTGLPEGLREMEGVELSEIQQASYESTAADLTKNGVPNVTLQVRDRSEEAVFQLMRVLMDTVAVKGRLQQLHGTAGGELDYENELTYQQDGVEGYKRLMREKMEGMRPSPDAPSLRARAPGPAARQ